MKTELELFDIEGAPGGNQDWFRDPMMHLGGCAAVCACDSCIYFERSRGASGLYPFDKNALCREDYIRFSDIMKPYLRPRMHGVNRLSIYIDGFSDYLRDHGAAAIAMEPLPGDAPASEAYAALVHSVDGGLPVPCLILNHRGADYADYVWHWFLLTGYDADAGEGMVKTVTYGEEHWLPFAGLWDTGHAERGGLVIYRNI